MSHAHRPVLRFAPSPNGRLHIGHALSAIVGYELACRLGGRFLLRIEDIDPARSREAHVAAIIEDLAWLGITWAEPVLRQSARMDAYRAAAARLTAMGLTYPCFASRREIAEAAAKAGLGHDPDGAPLYPGLWRGAPPGEIARRMSTGEPHVVRLDMAKAIEAATERAPAGIGFVAIDEDLKETVVACNPGRWGDVVLQRRDVPTSYHLAVVVDDAFQGVTHVTRGADLLAATDVHRLLQTLLALPAPRYHHHRLITADGCRKLSKSARDTSLADLRAAGATPDMIRAAIGRPRQNENP